MKRLLRFSGVLLLALVGILALNYFRVAKRQVSPKPIAPISFDSQKAFENLAHAVTFQTISEQMDSNHADTAFAQFHQFLRTSYPLLFSRLTSVNCNSSANDLVFLWEGKNKSIDPLLLLAHQDVVPAGLEKDWEMKPYEARMDDTYIYGRGTLDDKSGVLGICEGIEFLLASGFQPQRSVYIAFGSDEETGGLSGAKQIAAWFEKNKIHFISILDEGGSIVQGVVPGVDKPVALIGIAEKGYATLTLTAAGEGGHSSMPPKQTAAGIIAKAVSKLEENPFPHRLTPVTRSMFDYIVAEMNPGMRLVFSNLWFFSPMVIRTMEKKNSTNAAVRTTTAATMLSGGTKENVLPVEAKAVVNFRILPGDSIASVKERVQTLIADDRVNIELGAFHNEPSPISDTASVGFKTLHQTISGVFSEALVAPYQLVGASDSKHYIHCSNTILRFLPVILDAEDLKRIHGKNERIRKDNYLKMVFFYAEYLKEATQAE